VSSICYVTAVVKGLPYGTLMVMMTFVWPVATLILSVATDLVLTRDAWWRWRYAWSLLTMALVTLGSVGLLLFRPTLASVFVAVIGIYRLVHLKRVISGHSEPQFMKQRLRTSAYGLGGLQLVIVAWTAVTHYIVPTWSAYATALAGIQMLCALGLYASLRRQLYTTRPYEKKLSTVSVSHLPSLTVAIPARNEDAQLEGCLTALLASDYPKLEVLVLDDSSQDKTPDIIKRYAHAGVRFVRGQKLHEGWVAKNQACAQLAHEASGELILFAGVDIRVTETSISRLVQLMLAKQKDMVCVLPLNRQFQQIPLLQSMRYFWEMVPPRRLFKRPPVLSSCWIIQRESLERAGGFAAVSRSITPEAHFAHSLAAHDGYSFIRSSEMLGISSEKPLASQHETALISRYPQLHRRLELVALLALAEVLLVVGAPLLAVAAAATQQLPALIMAMVAAIVLAAVYGQLQRTIFTRVSAFDAYLTYPWAVLADLIYLHLSCYRYEFAQVTWKDRDVAQAVMRRN